MWMVLAFLISRGTLMELHIDRLCVYDGFVGVVIGDIEIQRDFFDGGDFVFLKVGFPEDNGIYGTLAGGYGAGKYGVHFNPVDILVFDIHSNISVAVILNVNYHSGAEKGSVFIDTSDYDFKVVFVVYRFAAVVIGVFESFCGCCADSDYGRIRVIFQLGIEDIQCEFNICDFVNANPPDTYNSR